MEPNRPRGRGARRAAGNAPNGNWRRGGQGGGPMAENYRIAPEGNFNQGGNQRNHGDGLRNHEDAGRGDYGDRQRDRGQGNHGDGRRDGQRNQGNAGDPQRGAPRNRGAGHNGAPQEPHMEQWRQQGPPLKKDFRPMSIHNLGGMYDRFEPNELICELQGNPGWLARVSMSNVDAADLGLVARTFIKCLDTPNKNVLHNFLKDFFDKFRNCIMTSIGFLLDDINQIVAEVIYDVLKLLHGTCIIAPQENKGTAKTVVCLVQTSIEVLQRNIRNKDSVIKDICGEIEAQIETALLQEQTEKVKPKNQKIYGYINQDTPPNNYKEIEIYPTLEDIEEHRPFLRPNKIDGPYKDGNDYADTQFRLLREDFVKPLRDGVKAFLGLPPERRMKELKGNSVRYYFNVSCRGRICAKTNQVFAFAMQLSSRDYKHVNWDRSKRLGNGCIVGLTSDDFNTIVFAVVIQRDLEMLKKGVVSVECCRSCDEEHLAAGKVYSMIESTALFEAYKYNLQVLKALDTDEIPMGKYIVKVDKDITVPSFVTLQTVANLQPIMKEEKRTQTAVLNQYNWPKWNDTILDEAQYKAIQSALFKELCIIQGPPGTGKTHVGLKIVETMLLNNFTDKPILVVCYTNHALDQFLEGILKFTQNIVRVGGQCRNEEVQQYNLNELRHAKSSNVVWEKSAVNKTANKTRYRVKDLRHQINNKQQKTMEAIGKLIPAEALENCTNGTFNNPKAVYDWLEVDKRTAEFLKKEAQEDKRRKAQAREDDNDGRLDPMMRMAEEYQSDEEDGDEEKPNDEDNQDNRTVVEKLLALSQKKSTKGQDKYIEFELSASERKRLTEEEARQMEQRVFAGRGNRVMTVEDRWDLYRSWHMDYYNHLFKDTDASREEYSIMSKALKELEAEQDLQLLRGSKIIGMTTTGAAKYKQLYERLNVEVVVVEEAAELMEAHIVTTLSPSTKQLILIGDHQQLRPSPTDYKIATKFKLEISLFERLIENGLPYVRLQQQHRMRPEFTRIIVPHIYPTLASGERVMNYPNIIGMQDNLCLMNHDEEETHDNENKSKSNLFECHMVVQLTSYLILQGYKSEQITVLTMYSGQLFLVKQKMRELQLNSRVTSVDNYQGEENDIVIISFVRSNQTNTLGFLSSPNRLCVAFSRARMGLYCIGNFTMFASKMPLFNKMLESVANNASNKIVLKCQIHGKKTDICRPEDFRKVSEGGCDQACATRLAGCGHACPRQCHTYDLNHEKIKCTRPCGKPRECGHPCRKQCYEICGKCDVKIDKVIPACRHIIKVVCSQDLNELKCTLNCKSLLNCGHPCSRKCGDQCATFCKKMVEVVGRCGHEVRVFCSDRHDEFRVLSECRQPCRKELDCEHFCQGTCGTCFQGRLHEPCKSECGKNLICGHICKQPCSAVCPPCPRKCENSCVHSRCPSKCGEPCPPCKEECNRKCKHKRCTSLCSEDCSDGACEEPCTKRLKCGHPCIGFCTDPCPLKCRICDKDNLEDVCLGFEDEDSRYVMLEDCKHVIEAQGLQMYVAHFTQSTEISMGGFKCPVCSQAIKKSTRYIGVINNERLLIERVKAKCYGDVAENGRLLQRLRADIQRLDVGLSLLTRVPVPAQRQTRDEYTVTNNLLSKLYSVMNSVRNPDQMMITQWRNIFHVVERALKLSPKLAFMPKLDPFWKAVMASVEKSINQRVGQQQITDLADELLRFRDLENLSKELAVKPQEPLLQNCLQLIFSLDRFSPERAQLVIKNIKEAYMKRTGSALGISEEERVAIVNAMGFKQGHWYKCPNGHIYCIADCGGAMVESKCNECGARIGGGSHRLRDDNAVATAMDGARYGAWSEHYNDMRNFQM